MKAENHMI